MQNIIIKLNTLPEFIRSIDLVNLGLFPSEDAVGFARRRGLSPDYMQHGRRILYPKAGVISWIEKLMKKGDISISDQ